MILSVKMVHIDSDGLVWFMEFQLCYSITTIFNPIRLFVDSLFVLEKYLTP